MVYKVGITHTADDARLRAHEVNGGILRQVITVPNRTTAFLVERWVLDKYSKFQADVTADHFPQAGWTECWSVVGGYPNLESVKQRLLQQSGPSALVP
jgi:hypothetical protein